MVYGGLTAILAGLYAASIRLFNSLFTAVTGENSDLALVLTTLLLATTFTPIKGRLERFVDTWLRPQHNADVVPALPLDEPSLVALVDRRVQVALDRRLSSASAAATSSADTLASPAGASSADRAAEVMPAPTRHAGERDIG